MTAVVLVTGAGGVGKTTLAAAAGVTAAAAGLRTLVVTVDPARRLADALGLRELRNEPARVDGGGADLWASMLDVTASWEAVVHRYAPPDAATRLLDNPFFRAIADRFPAAQSFAAGEQMAVFVESGAWEVVVVDTPPSAGGIDFFLAPRSMQELVGGRLLRWLTGARLPARRTLYRLTARPALRLADAVLGGPLLEEVAEFLLDLRTLYDGLATRARVIERRFREATTVVVTTAQPTPLREARRFFLELPEVIGRPETVVFNRSLPSEWLQPSPPIGAELDAVAKRLVEDNLARWSAESRRQADAVREFSAQHHVDPIAVPWVAEAPGDLSALADLVAGTGIDTLVAHDRP